MTTAPDIVKRLGGKWSGRNTMCQCPAHGGKSLSVGQTRDGRPLLKCFGGCDQTAVIDALRGMGLWEGKAVADPSAPTHFTREPDGMDADARSRREKARQIWKDSLPIAGSLGERYLLYRGITLKLPSTLRFCPKLLHSGTKSTWPAMLGAIVDEADRVCAVQRTYLRPDGLGKAELDGKTIEGAKLTLGPMEHGTVQLGTPREILGIAEGIETALSARQLFSLPVWAVLSATRLNVVRPPPGVKQIVIFADNGRVGIEEARKARAAYHDRGLLCSIETPADGLSDFNDMLQDTVSA